MNKIEESSNGDDVDCLYCGHWYLKSTEGWVKCSVCKNWAHYSCAGKDDNDYEVCYICDICKPQVNVIIIFFFT